MHLLLWLYQEIVDSPLSQHLMLHWAMITMTIYGSLTPKRESQSA